MRFSPRPASVLLMLIPLLAGSTAAAQQGPVGHGVAQDSLVPLEFVEIVAAGAWSSPLQRLLAGRLPEPLDSLLDLPEGARVVGSLVRGRSGHAGIAMPGPGTAAWVTWEEVLERAGFERFQEQPGPGFISSHEHGMNLFCHGDTLAVTLVTREHRDRTYAVLHTFLPGSRTPCEETPIRLNRPDAPIPALRPPAGSFSTGSGIGGGSDGWNASAGLQTELGVRALLDHYDEQLRSSGWEPGDPIDGEAAGLRVYGFTDERGDAWRGTLTAHRLQPGTYDVSVRVVRVDAGVNGGL